MQVNIVRFYGTVQESDGSIYVLMQYVAQGKLMEGGKLELPVVVEILVQCLEGLAYLHGKGIMHRDMKPERIVMESDIPVRVKIVDFGLAIEGEIADTPCGIVIFQAPEVLKGDRYTYAVDIWCLGVTALDMLKKIPEREAEQFWRSKQAKDHKRYIEALHRSCESLPPALSEFLLGMLAVNPASRWSAKQCLQEIKKVQRTLRGPGHVGSNPAPGPVNHGLGPRPRKHLDVPGHDDQMPRARNAVEHRPRALANENVNIINIRPPRRP
jgi:serine/threonine protein kinase